MILVKSKVLVIGSDLDDKGGIVSVIRNIKSSSLNEKYEFIHISTYDTVSKIKKIKIYLKGLIKFTQHLMFSKFDIVHIHMSYNGSFYRKSIIILLSKLSRKKIILHMHGSCFKEFYLGMGNLNRNYCKFIFNKVDRIIALSNSWKAFFETIVEDSNKIIVINNSIVINEKHLNIKKQNKNNIIFLFLGRLGKRKGVYDLIDAFEKLVHNLDKSKNVKLVLAGDGEIDEVNKIIKNRDLQDNIINLGWIDGENKDILMKNADAYVLPSYNEGLPMSILEAMSYHLPCISTNVGGIPEVIINNYNGYIFEPGNIDMLAELLEKMVIYDDERLTMGENSFITVEKYFNSDNEFLKLDSLYVELGEI